MTGSASPKENSVNLICTLSAAARNKLLLRAVAKTVEDAASGCLLWTASRDAKGYGRIRIGEKIELAHRVFHVFREGPIPAGMIVRHMCHNPLCVRHTMVGTHADNAQDRDQAGRNGTLGRHVANPRRLRPEDVLGMPFFRLDHTVEETTEAYGVGVETIRRVGKGGKSHIKQVLKHLDTVLKDPDSKDHQS